MSIDIGKIKKDVINYGALKVYEYTIDALDDELELNVLTDAQVKDILKNQYDIVKVNVNMIETDEETGAVVRHLNLCMMFFKAQSVMDVMNSAEMLIYETFADDDRTISQLKIMRSGSEYDHEINEIIIPEESSSNDNGGEGEGE